MWGCCKNSGAKGNDGSGRLGALVRSKGARVVLVLAAMCIGLGALWRDTLPDHPVKQWVYAGAMITTPVEQPSPSSSSSSAAVAGGVPVVSFVSTNEGKVHNEQGAMGGWDRVEVEKVEEERVEKKVAPQEKPVEKAGLDSAHSAATVEEKEEEATLVEEEEEEEEEEEVEEEEEEDLGEDDEAWHLEEDDEGDWEDDEGDWEEVGRTEAKAAPARAVKKEQKQEEEKDEAAAKPVSARKEEKEEEEEEDKEAAAERHLAQCEVDFKRAFVPKTKQVVPPVLYSFPGTSVIISFFGALPPTSFFLTVSSLSFSFFPIHTQAAATPGRGS